MSLHTLLWAESIGDKIRWLDAFSLGLSLENLLSAPMEYDSGHSEKWYTGATVGVSIRFPFGLLVAVDGESNGLLRIGAEWNRSTRLMIRSGICIGGTPSISIGAGTSVRGFEFDFALMWQKLIPAELRASTTFHW